jgi:hypothetical protein
LKSSKTREPEKKDQQTSSFVFYVAKRNEMQMISDFPFSFMNKGKKVKRKKENNQESLKQNNQTRNSSQPHTTDLSTHLKNLITKRNIFKIISKSFQRLNTIIKEKSNPIGSDCTE